MSKNIQPGEWQTETDPLGRKRRFRQVGSCIEYEGTVTTTQGTFTQGEIAEGILHNTPKASPPRTEVEEKEGYCPFVSGRRVQCKEECAFWSKGGCMQSYDTRGRKCPLSKYPCDESCMLFNNGCSLIRKVR